jgi:hypothetical protein
MMYLYRYLENYFHIEINNILYSKYIVKVYHII